MHAERGGPPLVSPTAPRPARNREPTLFENPPEATLQPSQDLQTHTAHYIVQNFSASSPAIRVPPATLPVNSADTVASIDSSILDSFVAACCLYRFMLGCCFCDEFFF